MTAVTRTRALPDRPLAHAGFVLGGLLLGAGIGVAPEMTAIGSIGLLLVTIVALRPPVAASLLIVSSLLLAGIDRGVLIPLLRPQEAVLALVVTGLLVAGAAGLVTGRSRLAVRFDRIDAVMIAMALAASVLPLAVMVWRDEPDVELDDLLYALQLWKFYAVFVVARVSLRTAQEVGRCLWITMGAAAVVGVIGVLQSLGLFGVQELMTAYFKPVGEDASSFDLTRATSTVGSPFSVGDVMIFSAAVAAAFLVKGHPQRGVLAALTGFFLFCAVSAGQFSIAIGVVVAMVAFGLITRRLGRAVGVLLLVAVAAGIVLQPVIQNRLRSFDNAAGIPRSWEGRIENLEVFFLPVLEEDNRWITGVRPATRVPAPEKWRNYVYIESGYLALVWTGGVVLLAIFVLFLVVIMRRMVHTSRSRGDPIGVAATAAFTALAVIVVVTIVDIHLTLRGAGELLFALMAMGLPRPGTEGD